MQSFYVQTSAQLESTRLTALGNVYGNPWLVNSVNAEYDLQHHGLLGPCRTITVSCGEQC